MIKAQLNTYIGTKKNEIILSGFKDLEEAEEFLKVLKLEKKVE